VTLNELLKTAESLYEGNAKVLTDFLDRPFNSHRTSEGITLYNQNDKSKYIEVLKRREDDGTIHLEINDLTG
jgi:hypothetical protein